MTREKRVYYSDAVYHVSLRGNNKRDVLGTAEDKKIFLELLGKFKIRLGFKLYGLVLMDNHAHLVIHPVDKFNISRIMQSISLSFSFKFRKRYNYSGHVWQGRFKSSLVDEDRYLLNCLEYIHNNPVRAGLVRKAEDYVWSSCRFYHSLPSLIKEYIGIDSFMH